MRLVDLHMHTRYSDGENEVWEMVEEAVSLGVEEIAVTDHVWRDSEWFDDYCHDITMCEKKYGIKVHIGFEAKALSTRGAIDASTEMCSQASVRLGAVHRIPKGEEEYRYLSREEVRKDPVLAYDNWLSTTLAMIANSDVDIIAHPCFAPFKYGLEIQSEDVRTLFKQACQYEKKLELSQRYPECNGPLLDIVGKAPMLGQILSFGSDAHSVQDLRNAFRKLVE